MPADRKTKEMRDMLAPAENLNWPEGSYVVLRLPKDTFVDKARIVRQWWCVRVRP